MNLPRYKTLAAELRDEIQSGKYGIGSFLPPELQLCEIYSVSRHTMRDALRLLREAGMVERRRGSGTRIRAQKSRPAYMQPLGGIDELLQFAQDATIEVRRIDRRPMTTAERRRMSIDDRNDWIVVEALRTSRNVPLALSEIYINRKYEAVAPMLDGMAGAVHELIARHFGVEPDRVEQDISADILGPETARLLHSEPRMAALLTLRRYFDEQGEMLFASDSVMPGGRFSYSMTYYRDSPHVSPF